MKPLAHRARYLVLGRAVSVATDSPELLGAFDRDYGRFRAEGPDPAAALRLSVRLAPESGAGIEIEAASGAGAAEPRRLAVHGDPVRSAYRALLRELFAGLEGFVVLHAAVAGHGGGALLLAGPPGVGKTTLVLRLAEAGLAFFSDDFCPIDRATGLVHPFPRSAWVAGEGAEGRGGARPRKRPVPPPETAAPGGLLPCPPRWVIVLHPGDAPEGRRTLEIAADPSALEGLTRDLELLGAGLTVVPGGTELPALRVRYRTGAGLAAGVRSVLARHRPAIREVFHDDAVRPDFDRAPALTPIARHEAAFSLLDDIKRAPWAGPPDAPGLPEAPAAFLMELTGLLGEASAHRLTVGRLEEMCDRVLGLLGDRAGAGDRR